MKSLHIRRRYAFSVIKLVFAGIILSVCIQPVFVRASSGTQWNEIFETANVEVSAQADAGSFNTYYAKNPIGLKLTTVETGAEANGSSIKFKAPFSGDLMFRYSPVPKQSGGSTYQDNFAFRKLIFRFTDLENPDNTFDFVLHNYNPWNKNDDGSCNPYPVKDSMGSLSYVEYNSLKRTFNFAENKIKKGGTNGTEYPDGGHAVGCFVGASILKQYSTVKWISEEKQIQVVNNHSGWAEKTIADLDDPAYEWGKDFSGFDWYNVEIIFEEVQEGQNASLMLFNSSISNWGEYTFSNADTGINKIPVVVTNLIKEYEIGRGLKMCGKQYKVNFADFEDGYVSSYIGADNVEAKFGKGETVDGATDITAETVFPEEAGTYNIFVRVKDTNGAYSEWVKAGSFDILDPIAYAMDMGASIRFSDPTGIRFTARIDTEDLNTLKTTYGEENVKLGMKITRGDGAYAFVDMVNFFEEDGKTVFNGVVANIKDYNATYTARAYAEITFENGNVVRYFVDDNDNTRSVAGVAKKALEDPEAETKYSAEQLEILRKFAGGVN